MQSFVLKVNVLVMAYFAFYSAIVDGKRFRSMGINETDSNPTSPCVDACNDVFTQLIDEVFAAELYDTSVTVLAVPVTQTYYYQLLCQGFENATNCVGKCPNGTSKATWIQDAAVFRYMCQQPDKYKRHVDCFHQVRNSSEGKCAQQACSQHQPNPSQQGDPNETLQRQCELWKCGLDCLKPAIIKKCKQSAYDVLKSLTAKWVEYKATPEIYPAECEELAEDDMDPEN